jgi:hypothetical protein
MSTRKQFALAAVVVLTAAFLSWMPAQVLASGNKTFVPYGIAAVRIDGNPPKEWNLYYESHGKTEVVLLEWGNRFMLLDAKLKEARDLKPDSVTRKKGSVTWNGNNSATTILPSDDWVFRDVGNAKRMHLKLTAESHEIEIDLPQYRK